MERKELIHTISNIAKGRDSYVLKLLKYIEEIELRNYVSTPKEEMKIKIDSEIRMKRKEKEKINYAAQKICEYYGITIEMLKGKYNRREKHNAQFMLYYWAQLLQINTDKIVEYLERNRTSKYYHLKNLHLLSDVDKDFAKKLV